MSWVQRVVKLGQGAMVRHGVRRETIQLQCNNKILSPFPVQQHIWSSWVNAPYHCDAGDEGDLGAHGETEVSGVGSENEHLCNVV